MSTPLDFHITADGKKWLIADMGTSHLINTVHLGMRRVGAAFSAGDTMTEYQRALRGIKATNPSDMADLWKAILDKMSAYLVELGMRDLSGITPIDARKLGDIRTWYAQFMGRPEGWQGGQPISNQIQQLKSGTVGDYLDDDLDSPWDAEF